MNQDAAVTANPAASTDDERGSRKRVVGIVSSDRMDKTRVVQVEELYQHPKYRKFLRRTQKFHVHDEKNESKTGDKVMIVETRPLSRTKRWRLLKLIERPV